MSLEDRYQNEILPFFLDKHGYNNPYAVPRIVKVVLNVGLGRAKDNPKELERAIQDLSLIAGQRAVATHAHHSVSGFTLRQGQAIGVKVSLRGRRMYQFLEKLFRVVLPRTRDFRGLPRSGFDGQGNYSLGLEEQVVFLEIDANKVDRLRGLQVTIVTTAKTDTEAELLLVKMGLPLEKKPENLREKSKVSVR